MSAIGLVAVVVAAGIGARAGDGGGPPKQYRPIRGVCALARAIEALAAHPRIDAVRVAIRHADRARYAALVARLSARARGKLAPAVAGGAERGDTVAAALEAIGASDGEQPRRVLIHDAARPFLPLRVINSALAALDADPSLDGACAALPAVDTLRRGEEGLCGAIVPRSGLVRAQTPQIFDFEALRAAYRAGLAEGATDDAEVARRAGLRVAVTSGDRALEKITTPEDFVWAERQAAGVTDGGAVLEPRSGVGYDVHRFGVDAVGRRDRVTLCGVDVPHDDGLAGHSDADVALHALTDAVLGAIAAGDIGAHFPPQDPVWRGAASDVFLGHAVGLVGAMGGRLTHLDVTLVCERPKIRPYAAAMRLRLAEIAGVDVGRASVKATTTERLGFEGRGEGIAAIACASVLIPENAETPEAAAVQLDAEALFHTSLSAVGDPSASPLETDRDERLRDPAHTAATRGTR